MRNESAVHIVQNRLGAWDILQGWMDLIASELGLLAIDHEHHICNAFGGTIDDQAFRGNLLLGTEGVGIGIDCSSRRRGPIENEFDSYIGPLLPVSQMRRGQSC